MCLHTQGICLGVTFIHLADAFIQSDLQCIQAIHLYYQYVWSLGIEPTTFALLTLCSTTEPQKHSLLLGASSTESTNIVQTTYSVIEVIKNTYNEENGQ